MQLAAAFAAGAGFSLAAAHLVMRRRGARPRVSDARSGAPEAGLPVPCDSELGVPTPPRCEGADWGSPVMPRSEQEEGNRTMSPSKLPRPRKLFADAGDGEVALVDYQLTHVISAGALRLGSRELHLDKYVQPASIDLPISGTVFLVKEKVLPFRKQVRQLVEGLVLEEKEFGSNGTVLLKGQTYLVFCGTVRLPVGCRGCLSPKSSIGRVDVMVRGVVDGCGLYDIVPGDGKERELWLEISPRSFNVRVSPGSAMTQLMLFMSPDRMVECGLPVLDSTQIHSHRGAVAGSHDAPQAPATRTTREGVLGGAIESMATIDHSFEVERGGEDERGAAEQDAAAPTTPLRCGSGGEDDAVGESMEEELEAKICYDDDGKVLPLHLHKGALVLSVCIPSDQAVIAGYEAIATEEVADPPCMHACMHACVCVRVYACMLACMDVCMSMHAFEHACVYMRTRIM